MAGGVKRVLLIGFMGSGKTVVGQTLARRLDWSFRDFDEEIRSRVGLPIPDIFSQHGEGFFREVEERVGSRLLNEEEVVLASGGGWPAAHGRMDNLPPGTLTVWLQVTAEEAVRRVREEGPTRPLLAVPDPLASARDLLMVRERYYRKAAVALDTEGSAPDDLVQRILDRIHGPPEGVEPD